MPQQILDWLTKAMANPEQMAQILTIIDKLFPIIERILALGEKYPAIVNLLLDRFFPKALIVSAPLSPAGKAMQAWTEKTMTGARMANIRKQKARRRS